MADNYLERKMEDLRRGASSTAPSKRQAPRKGYVQFPFPPKRILIATEAEASKDIARLFLRYDCKVALTIADNQEGEQMARNEGIRFYPMPFGETQFVNLLDAWRDVDIIVTDKEYISLILPRWKAHRERFPYVSSYTSRLIILGDDDIESLMKDLSPYKIAVNSIFPSDNPYRRKTTNDDLTRLILILSLPENDFINGMRLPVM